MDRTRRQLLGGIGGAAAAVALRQVTALAQNAPSPFGARFETSDQYITDQELWSPVEVTAPDVTFERCRFKSTDPQHTLLTTGERTQVHDCDFLGNYTYGGRRGIAVNSPGVVITKSRFRDLHHAQDAQCIAGWDNTRDLLIEDCFGEASGENIIFGGADAQSEDRQPQDIIIRRCTLTKPTYWQSKPSGATVKNCFEIKNAKRVQVLDCNFAQSLGRWADGLLYRADGAQPGRRQPVGARRGRHVPQMRDPRHDRRDSDARRRRHAPVRHHEAHRVRPLPL